MGKGGKKLSDPLIKLLEEIDPSVREFARDRLVLGKNLFDSKTHKLRPKFRDREQGKMILRVVKRLHEITGHPLHFFCDELRLLKTNGDKPLLAFCLAAILLLAELYDYFQ